MYIVTLLTAVGQIPVGGELPFYITAVFGDSVAKWEESSVISVITVLFKLLRGSIKRSAMQATAITSALASAASLKRVKTGARHKTEEISTDNGKQRDDGDSHCCVAIISLCCNKRAEINF